MRGKRDLYLIAKNLVQNGKTVKEACKETGISGFCYSSYKKKENGEMMKRDKDRLLKKSKSIKSNPEFLDITPSLKSIQINSDKRTVLLITSDEDLILNILKRAL